MHEGYGDSDQAAVNAAVMRYRRVLMSVNSPPHWVQDGASLGLSRWQLSQ